MTKNISDADKEVEMPCLQTQLHISAKFSQLKQSFGWIGSQIHMKNHTTTFNFYENEIWKSVTANQPVTVTHCNRAESWPDSYKNRLLSSMLPIFYFFTEFMILTNSRGHEDTGAE